MALSAEMNALPAALQATLNKAVVQAELTEVPLVDGCLPLVLMSRGHALEAFAVGDEDDYLPLYTAFKHHFMANGAAWATKDVSFIYCLPAGHSAADEFCSKVEVDVYFCRKYVIQLEQDIAASLARLPFLPLSPIEGGAIRPPSAQAFLRSRSVKTELANRLVVQGTSAQTILQACIDDKYGKPAGIEGGGVEAVQAVSEEPRSQSVLKSICVQNFRAYRTPKEFRLGSALTILYGPNGFGKTSFFDAIDFAVTGSVGRLAKTSAGLAKAAKHLDCGLEPTTVALTFEREGVSHTIVRDLADPNKATLDGKVVDRKEILAMLTGGEPSASDRVDNLVSLFRATHLFSQDQQELTGSIAESCELPGDIVSRMLAFDDYVIGVKKSKEVLDLARRQVADAEGRLKEARRQAEADEVELKRLQGLQSIGGKSDILGTRAKELEQSIEQAGFSLGGLAADRDTRSLRALLEASGAEAGSRKSALEKCLDTLATLRATQVELKAHETLLSQYEGALTSAEAVERVNAQNLQDSESELARFRRAETEGRSTRESITWVISVRPEFTRLSAEAIDLKAKLDQALSLCVRHRALHVDATAALFAAVEALGKAEALHRAACEQTAQVRAVQGSVGQGMALTSLVAETRVQEGQLSRSLEELRAKLNEEHQAALAQQLLVERLQRGLNSARRDASEIQDLVAALRSHVSDGSCLLCGHDHGTADGLLKAIDRRLERNESLVRISEQLAEETAKKDRLDAARQGVSDQLRQIEQRRTQVSEQRVELERRREGFRAALAAIGLEIGEELPQQLSSLVAQTEEAERQAASRLEAAKQVHLDAGSAVAASAEAEHATATEVDALSRGLRTSEGSLNAFVNDPRRGAFDFAAALSSLEVALEEVNIRLSTAAASVQHVSEIVERNRGELAASRARVAAARGAHQSAARHKSALEGQVQSLSAALSAAGLNSEISSDDVLASISAAVARQESAVSLTRRLAELEIALDAAATSAAFESIRNRLNDNKRVADSSQARVEQLAQWVKYFETVHRVLGSQQAAATEHFTHEYGPRTAVIQRRLRPVYGFGDIEVSSKGTSIAVHVKRNDEDLRPTDYFSQSQVQTLVLGLFLTACSSQTWSGFSSIMMDDPVTHFDDLNTYALLDLISGLQSSPEGNKQFVISTCDERLLQLARQKFRHLGDAAKFYSFSAIGASGPMVAAIPA